MDSKSTKPAPPQAVAASTMMGDDVRNLEGEDVGTIADLMVDLATGRVTYAVLSFGGFLGLGEKLYAVPWVSLRPDPEGDRFVLDVDRDRLARAPGFDKDDWPNMGGTYWGTDVPKFWT